MEVLKNVLTDIWHDLRYGLRTMRKNPVFSLVAVLTIAIGIGANVVVFTLVERILLSPLPYPEPDRLVRLLQAYPEMGLTNWGLSPANFVRYRDGNRSFEAIAAFDTTGAILTGSERPEYVQAGRVTADFFKVFGVNAMVGRTFNPDEDAPGKNNVVVLSHNLWQRRFGADPQIVGKSLVLSGVPTQVIGVAPPSFRFPAPQTELWTTMALNPQATAPFLLAGIARLKPGLSPSAAAADTTAVLRNAAAENPAVVLRKSPPSAGSGLRTIVTPLKEVIVGNIKNRLLMVQIAVAFVLLIACANVANLLLSRVTRRTQEIAMRLALGASPIRIIRQLLTESLLLALIGAVAGTAFAWWSLRVLSRVYGEGIPRIEEAGISRTVLLVTVAMTLLTGLLFGLVPAFRAYWLGLKTGLNEGQKASAGYANRRLNSGLVVVQLAGSMVLLIGAGLVLKSFERLMTINPGFETEKVLTMILPVSKQKGSADQLMGFYKRLLQDVRALPGVNAAAVSSNIPFSGEPVVDGHVVEGQEPPDGDAPQAEIKVVSPAYFKSMGMPLQQGRDFQESDTGESPLVAIVDQALARRYWPNGGAVGKRIRTGDPEWYTIIGVVPTVKEQSLAAEPYPHLYLSNEQLGFAYGQSREQWRMYLVVNTESPDGVMPLIRERVRALDPDVPVYSVNTMSENVSKRLGAQRLINFLLMVFSGMALLLAAIGTYAMMSVFVSSRKAEFAIRLALGAQPRNLLTSVLKQGLLLAVIGLVIGLLGSLALTRALSSQLFEVSSTDPLVFILIPAVLILVTLFASFLPARRAANTDPAVVLRNS